MINFTGALRSVAGTAEARRLRREQRLPIIIYGKNKERHLLSLEHKTIFYAEQKEGFYSSPMTIEWVTQTGETEHRLVTIKEIQRHPFRNEILHVDFMLA